MAQYTVHNNLIIFPMKYQLSDCWHFEVFEGLNFKPLSTHLHVSPFLLRETYFVTSSSSLFFWRRRPFQNRVSPWKENFSLRKSWPLFRREALNKIVKLLPLKAYADFKQFRVLPQDLLFYGKPFYYLLCKTDILYVISDILFRI